ncbi:MAG: hypothetical protein JXJ04_08570, partial [Spirochaetales bacterium]|nr:hypothetical protein [Spirochaetales bacterium]
MIGAIAGDIIGSVYEFRDMKSTTFPLFHPGITFTDDTVLTVALADAILIRKNTGINNPGEIKKLYVEKLQQYGR